MKGLVVGLYDFFHKHKIAFLVSLCVSVLFISYFASKIKFEEDISKILQVDDKTRAYTSILQNTKLVDKLIISVSFSDSTLNDKQILISYADSLNEKLVATSQDLIKNTSLKADDIPFTQVYEIMLRNLPVFLEPGDYIAFDSILTPDSIAKHIASAKQLLATPAGMVIQQTLKYDPVGFSTPFTKRLQKQGNSSDYELIDGYYFSKNHNGLLIFIEPVNASNETSRNAQLIKNLDQSIQKLAQSENFKSVRCLYTGSTAIAVGNARQIQNDTLLTLSVMMGMLVLVLFLLFRKKRTTLLVFSPVVFGLLFALAIIVFIKPTISLIAMGASTVLLGIAVNFPLHFLTHSLHEKDIRRIISEMVTPMTIGSATTIGGFICLLFVKAELLHDFGLLGALSLVGAVFFSLVFLPHFISTDVAHLETNKFIALLEKASNVKLETKRIPILLIFIVTPVLFYFSRNVQFDTNLGNLNYMTPELKQADTFMKGKDSTFQSIYLISYGKTTDDAINSAKQINKWCDSLNEQGVPHSYMGLSNTIPSQNEQEIRINQWKEFWTSKKREAVKKSLEIEAKKQGFKATAFQNFMDLIDSPPVRVDSSDFRFLINTFGRDALTINDTITTIVSVIKMSVGESKKYSGSISNIPNTVPLDRSVLSNQLMKTISKDFNFIAIVTALIVFIALLLTYGRIELALTTFIPMVVSWIWILGLMSLFHIKFNMVSIILSSFIFGLGDDYCIFIMDGLLQQYKTGKKQLPVIKMSIILSGLTTLIGFGVLFLAKHPAMQSLAAVSVIGILSVLFISQTLQPYLFRKFVSDPASRNQPPISLLTFIISIFAYTFFLSGSLMLSIIGLFTAKLNPFGIQKGRRFLNLCICWFVRAQVYVMINLKKTIVKVEEPDYSKPCIIISNHQGVIDILIMAGLNPKVVLLTNKWVWNSPVFGQVVKMAGYFPIIDSVETSIEEIKQRIDEGYSIGVFPEGTRHTDGKLGRFHKGAFYLAHELQLDILPVILQGTGACIPKGSNILYSYPLSHKILPRIRHNDLSFGVTYQERTKKISAYFKKEYETFLKEQENPDYHSRRLINSYLFKGPVLEWYMKVKLRLEKNYTLFHELVPLEGKIIDAGCGYGFMTYMLSYLSEKRELIGLDYDEEKIEVANTNYTKSAALQFRATDIKEYNFPASDCILFSDVLHYLTKEDRQNVVVNAINSLNKGGSIIIRDGDNSMQQKHKGTKLTEILSTKIFRFNKTNNELDFFSAQAMIDLGEKYNLRARLIDHTKWSSNVILILQKES